MAHLPGESGLTALKTLASSALDRILPPQCPQCGTETSQSGSLCAHCWSEIRFITDPICACCGLPLELDPGLGFDALCGACHRSPPVFDRARAAFLYDPNSRGLILKLKHADRLDLLPGFAPWLLRAGRSLLAEADYLVPVPLHWSRLLSRRYNQAAELARLLTDQSKAMFAAEALIRHKRTGSQGHRSRSQRQRNVSGAFAVAPRWRARLKGAHVVLIDDVLTTGATANACAKALKRGGSRTVDLLTLARVPGPED